MKKILVGIILFLIMVVSVIAPNINSCQTLSIPDVYVLTQGIAGGNCIEITNSTISFDCNGHQINGTIYIHNAASSGISITHCVIKAGVGIDIYANITASSFMYNDFLSSGTNDVGIYVYNGTTLSGFAYNNFTNIENAFYIAQLFQNNILTYNNFFNSTKDIGTTGSPAINSNTIDLNIFNGSGEGKNRISASISDSNAWDDGSAGNVWDNLDGVSGYSNFCTDANNDSVCDLSYTINNANNIDHYPLKSLLGAHNDTCTAAAGCYLNETFTYLDSVLNHNWQGWNINPSSGRYFCVNQNQYNIRHFLTINNPYVINFDVSLCPGNSTGLTLMVGDGELANFIINMRDDGIIVDGATGAGIGTFSTVCNGYVNDTNVKILAFPQNNPPTYDLYIDGVVQSQNNPWADNGGVSTTSWIYVSGNYVPQYCNWALNDISIYLGAGVIPSNLTASQQEFQFGAFNLNPGNASFDWSQCKEGENKNICFIRLSGGGLITGFWKLIVKYPLEVLGLILLIVAYVFIKGRTGGGGK